MPLENLNFPLPLIESQQTYAAASLAWEIQNLRRSPTGVLEPVRGPCPYIPDRGAGYPWPGKIYGVFHTLLHHGERDVLLVRSGTKLFEVTGWETVSGTHVRELASGLSDEPNARFPDQFVQVGGLVVWNNGIDAPLVFDGETIGPLGYDRVPNAPTTGGPSCGGHPVFRNDLAYSHPGKIGSIGDVFTTQSGALLSGVWYYAYLWEDEWGNRSPPSALSSGVTLRRELTQTLAWKDYANYAKDFLGVDTKQLGLNSVGLDDLTKQFVLEGVRKGRGGTLRKVVFRTKNAEFHGNTLYELGVIDNETDTFPDNTPDAGLGAELVRYMVTPSFQAMCAHAGCLVVLEGQNLRISDPLFCGSFRPERYTPLEGEPRGVFSFGGRLYAATSTVIYLVENTDGIPTARVISEGTGLVGPNAVGRLGTGECLGIGPDAWWSMSLEGKVTSVSRGMAPLLGRLNLARASHAWVVWSPLDLEGLVGLPEAGGNGNTLIMTYDGSGWRRRRYGMAVEHAALVQDFRRYVLAGARVGGTDILVNLHGETYSYSAPTKTYAFRSGWLSPDPQRQQRFNLDFIYVGIVETQLTDITVTVWQNGTRDVGKTLRPINAVGPGAARDETFNVLKLGTGKAREPRLTWKKVPVALHSVDCFAFDLTCVEPGRFSIAAFGIGTIRVEAAFSRMSEE